MTEALNFIIELLGQGHKTDLFWLLDFWLLLGEAISQTTNFNEEKSTRLCDQGLKSLGYSRLVLYIRFSGLGLCKPSCWARQGQKNGLNFIVFQIILLLASSSRFFSVRPLFVRPKFAAPSNFFLSFDSSAKKLLIPDFILQCNHSNLEVRFKGFPRPLQSTVVTFAKIWSKYKIRQHKFYCRSERESLHPKISIQEKIDR